MEFWSQQVESTIGLLRPQDGEGDRTSGQIGQLQAGGICLLGREAEFEGPVFAAIVLAITDAPERQFQLGVLLTASLLSDQDKWPGRCNLLTQAACTGRA